jgi:hypothetical protein
MDGGLRVVPSNPRELPDPAHAGSRQFACHCLPTRYRTRRCEEVFSWKAEEISYGIPCLPRVLR